MGGLSRVLSRDDSLRPRLWSTKQCIFGGVPRNISDIGKQQLSAGKEWAKDSRFGLTTSDPC